ncbi:MAG: carbohydrate kinase [Verrucomicrobia bacterium]|nr:carbohydrate kinase [Verrucomicrobiota bacterium]
MNPARFQAIVGKNPQLRIAVVGDFSLDRYLEIDVSRREISLETNLPVYNVVNVRSQPGAAGTILNNLVALGIGTIFPVGFCGHDGEGFELRRALSAKAGVKLDHFLQTPDRRTFTYCKPLLTEPGKPPVELNRFDSKNWTPTPAVVQGQIIDAVQKLAAQVDAMILMDQVDVPETGVVTTKLLEAIKTISLTRRELLIMADSRRGLRGYPPITFKMNGAELSALTGVLGQPTLDEIKETAAALSRRQSRNVFVTLAERGLLGASPDGRVEHVPALPVRGEIDIVGAGDSVTANLTASLAAGAGVREALEIANAAASIVIHQLGTTGTASPGEIEKLLMV